MGLFFTLLVSLAALAAEPADSSLYSQLKKKCRDHRPLGIDISHHSGAVDWDKLASAKGIDFVILKASEGVDTPDPAFNKFLESAKQRKISVGAYHFYVTEDDPVDQAKLYLGQIAGKKIDMHPVVDIEIVGRNTPKDFAKNLRIFVNEIEKGTGLKTIVYTSAKFWDSKVNLDLGDHHLWIAEYGVSQPTLPKAWKKWMLWQYEENKRVQGIEKDVDFSYFNCDGP